MKQKDSGSLSNDILFERIQGRSMWKICILGGEFYKMT